MIARRSGLADAMASKRTLVLVPSLSLVQQTIREWSTAGIKKATSKPVDSTGSYLTVYKKESDGSWKAVEDFITPGPAAAPAAK